MHAMNALGGVQLGETISLSAIPQISTQGEFGRKIRLFRFTFQPHATPIDHTFPRDNASAEQGVPEELVFFFHAAN